MSVDINKQVFLGGTAKGELTFNNDLVVGPQILGDTSAKYGSLNLTDHLVLEIGYGQKWRM